MKNKRNLLMILALVLLITLVVVGCDKAKPTTTEPTKPATAPAPTKAEFAKVISLTDQVKNSGHAKLFPTMIGMGPDVKKDETEHYGDGCIRCHSAVNILDDPAAKLDDFFTGGKYAGKTEGISCRVCHTFQGKDLISLRNNSWNSCGICHVNSSGDPKLGSEVHHPQFQMIKGVAIGDFPERPSYKYKNMKDTFACQDCHITNGQNHNFFVPGVTPSYSDAAKIKRNGTKIDYERFKDVFKQDKCLTCHANPQPLVDKIKAHQEEIEKKLKAIKPTYDEWSKKTATMDKNDPKVKAFQNGATFFTFVEADASKGAHNYDYAKAALEKAESYWKELK